ncbi:MAG: hypothetical protein GSR85_02115 [Desulfurococcales archaeon]|nr:hypothetical protein [Desulfurococcales archaeon]
MSLPRDLKDELIGRVRKEAKKGLEDKVERLKEEKRKREEQLKQKYLKAAEEFAAKLR